ncbi:MAG TPA: hypothetical protein VE082_08980, partial [Desulfobaccales bacterium]|nr:hypothetical protein [Desulfobaccales bacterium]
MKTKVSLVLLALLFAGLFGGEGGARSARAQSEGPAGPQAPGGSPATAFTYQGQLQDGGHPANGSYDFRFILYDAGTDGNQVGVTLEKGDLAVSQGIFSTVLDFGNPYNGQLLWLEVAVRPGDSTGAYTALSPRQALTAAPYAAYSYGVNAASHNHLGQTWSGGNNPLEITGSFGMPDYAPLVLSNPTGYGLRVISAGYAGVRVNSAGMDGVYVNTAGSPSSYSISTANNGFEVAGAQGNGFYVGQADLDGVVVRSVGSPSTYVFSTAKNGVEVAGAQGNGLYVGRADSDGVYVRSAGRYGVYAHTARTDHNYGLYTPDNIYGLNMA